LCAGKWRAVWGEHFINKSIGGIAGKIHGDRETGLRNAGFGDAGNTNSVKIISEVLPQKYHCKNITAKISHTIP
jgi:hypothetical protein